MATSPKSKAKAGVDREALAALRDKLRDRKKKGEGSGWPWLALEEGETVIRILPGHPNMDSFYKDVWYHRRSFGKKKQIQVPCLNEGDLHGDNGCPICEELAPLAKTKDKKDKDLFYAEKAKQRFFLNVLCRGKLEDGKLVPAEEPDTVQVLGCGSKIFEPLLNHIIDEEEFGDVLDVTEGCDFKITRVGSGLDTEYSVLIRPKKKPISSDPDEIIGTGADDTKLNDLSEMGEVKDVEDLVVAWETGEWPEKDEKSSKKSKSKKDEDEDEEEDEPKPKSKKKPAPVEEEDEEDETPVVKKKKKVVVEDEEEEEEEPAPVKKKVKKPVVEEDEDEEEEPAPKKKVKKPVEDDDEDMEELESALAKAKAKKPVKK